jgi:hypothetical protein
MPSPVWNIDWLLSNATRKYPMIDGVDKKDTSGSFTIPDDFIVDLSFSVPPANYTDASLFHILSVVIFEQGCIITLGYNNTLVASASISRTTFTPNSVYTLYGSGIWENCSGSIIIGSLDNAVLQPFGAWTFSVSSTRLIPTVIRPALQGVSSITTISGNKQSVKLRGDIELVAGNNISITLSGTEENPVITIADAVITEDAEESTSIKTINGIGPNEEGNFTILGSSCMTVEEITNGIKFSDVCSEPCCGCDELKVVNDALNSLDSAVTTQGNYVARLEGMTLQLLQSVLASRMGEIYLPPPEDSSAPFTSL